MEKILFRVKAADLLTAVKRVKHCIGENESRRELMGINLSVTEDKLNILRVMASDGFRVARQSIAVTTDQPFNITIDLHTVKDRLIEKYLKQYTGTIITDIEEEIIYCRITENTLSLHNFSGLRILARNKEGIYWKDDPHNLSVKLNDEKYSTDSINRLLENSKSLKNSITVQRVEALYRAVDFLYYASDIDNRYKNVLKLSVDTLLEGNDSIILVTSPCFDLNKVQIGMTTGDNAFSEPIGLNCAFFSEALKIFKTEKAEYIRLSYEHAEKPCYLESDLDGFEQLVLPVRIRW